MINISVFITLLAICSADRPGKLHREYWGNQLMGINLVNLTLIMCKDANYKLRMADIVQSDYKHSMGYELGLLGSGIIDKFKHMLRIYRYYSNHKVFLAGEHSVSNILNGYHVMQSDYNEIRSECDLFYEVVNIHERKRAKDPRLLKFQADNPGADSSKFKNIDPSLINRRSMAATEDIDNDVGNNTKMMLRDKKPGNKTVWGKNDPEEAEYKKKLRYIMWAESWKGFNPETEGVHIADDVAKVGLANASNFLARELKGNF